MSEDGLDTDRLKAIVEAILVTASDPVTPGRLLGLVKEANGRQLREAVDALKEQYDKAGHAFTIAEVAGGFLLVSRPEYGPWVRKFHDKHQVRLSRASLETLAIIAFKQPITRAEIDAIRGVNSDGVVHTLLEHDLVRIVGRSDGVGKPHLFGTTREFLVHFGLKGLADLPKTKELAELLAADRKDEDAAPETDPPHEGSTPQDPQQEADVQETGDAQESDPDAPEDGPRQDVPGAADRQAPQGDAQDAATDDAQGGDAPPPTLS